MTLHMLPQRAADGLDVPARRLTYGDALKREMFKHGIKRHVLANNTGVNERTIVAWENNDETPTAKQHRAVVSTLNSMRFHPPPPLATDTTKNDKGSVVITPPPLPAGSVPTEQLSFGQALARERELEGMSKSDIASLLEVDPKSIVHWEAGARIHNAFYAQLLELFPRLKQAKPPLTHDVMRGRRRVVNVTNEKTTSTYVEPKIVSDLLKAPMASFIKEPLVATTDTLKLPTRGAVAAVIPPSKPTSIEEVMEEVGADTASGVFAQRGLNRTERRARGIHAASQELGRLDRKIAVLEAEQEAEGKVVAEQPKTPDATISTETLVERIVQLAEALWPETPRVAWAVMYRKAGDVGGSICGLLQCSPTHDMGTAPKLVYECGGSTPRDAGKAMHNWLQQQIITRAMALRAEAETTAQKLRDQAAALERLQRGL